MTTESCITQLGHHDPSVTAGSSALTRELVVRSANGDKRRLILRCFPVAWQGPPRSKVQRESRALSILAKSDLPVPEVLWANARGDPLGYPCTLQTRLPGHVSWPRAMEPGGASAMGRAWSAKASGAISRTSIPTSSGVVAREGRASSERAGLDVSVRSVIEYGRGP
jgi:aminoglycoside phosphotransferase (APT) family kinase protein